MQQAETIYALVLIALGWCGYYVLTLNSSKHFLNKMEFNLISALSMAFNIVGALYCLVLVLS